MYWEKQSINNGSADVGMAHMILLLLFVCLFACLLALFFNLIVQLIEENYSFGVRRYYWRVWTESVAHANKYDTIRYVLSPFLGFVY